MRVEYSGHRSITLDSFARKGGFIDMRMALWQTSPQVDVERALARLDRAMGSARTEGASVLVTPEMFLGGYNVGMKRCVENASFADETLIAVRQMCKRHGMAVVVGLALPHPDRPFNAAVAIDARGDEIARYHKTHLYGDVDRSQFTEGDALSAVFDLQGWRVGLAICYDIEFPEVARNLALKGADLVIVPTANMVPFESVPIRLVPARAEENAIFVAYANYVGAEGQFQYNGHSCVCGPDGTDFARADGETEQMLLADLEKGSLEAGRLRQTHLKDRRPDLYAPNIAKC